MGVSLILSRNEASRLELIYISLDRIFYNQLYYPNEKKIHLHIQSMQIDNQSSLHVPYPIILKPNEASLRKKDEFSDRPQPFLEIAMSMRTNISNIAYYFDCIDCLVQTMDIKLDDEIISFLYEFMEFYLNETQATVNRVHSIFLGYDSELLKQYDSLEDLNLLAESDAIKRKESEVNIRKRERQAPNPSLASNQNKHDPGILLKQQIGSNPSKDMQSKIYIEKLKLTPLEIIFSFFHKMKSEGKLLMSQAGIISKAIGVALINVQESTITFNSLEMDYVFGSTDDVLQKIYFYYSDQVIKTMLKLIGSIDFLGNPIKFLSSITTGIKDFFYKPITGIVKGPLVIPAGFYDGTKSLVQNTMVGTFGTLSNITSSWSKGLLALSNDDDYMMKREERFIKDKAETIVDGLAYGLSGALKSIQSGIVGIVKQPIEGARKKGFKGFLKGTFFGIAGAVVKPVSGVLDLVAKASEGGKNTATIFENSSEKRVRNPRAFYSKMLIVKSLVLYY